MITQSYYRTLFKRCTILLHKKRQNTIYLHREKQLHEVFHFIWRELAAYEKCGMPYKIGQTHSNTSHNTISIINVRIHIDHPGLTADSYLFNYITQAKLNMPNKHTAYTFMQKITRSNSNILSIQCSYVHFYGGVCMPSPVS